MEIHFPPVEVQYFVKPDDVRSRTKAKVHHSLLRQHRSQWVKVLKGAFSKNMFHFRFFSGSCYGGHYHAYIRDVEGLGTWHQPVSRM